MKEKVLLSTHHRYHKATETESAPRCIRHGHTHNKTESQQPKELMHTNTPQLLFPLYS